MTERSALARTGTAEAALSAAEEPSSRAEWLCRLFWLFFLAAFLGDLIEVVFCRFTMGRFMNRSSVLYGPFSLVWGVGAVMLTLALRRLNGRPNTWVFAAGTVLGGGYEYLCSWLQEVLFGASFWDYSHLPLNLNGRVNLVYCLFWGAAAVFWLRAIAPLFCWWISLIPRKLIKPLTIAAALLMAVNITLSGLALVRQSARQSGVPAANAVELFLDRHYPDQRLEQVYPTLHRVA